MKSINNFDMALLAEHGGHRPFEKRIFGHFETEGLIGVPVKLAFEAARYAYVGSPLALYLWVQDEGTPVYWEPYTALTHNLRPNDCKVNEVVIKAHDENEHLRNPLLNLGFFEDSGRRIASGYARFEIWRMTPAFVSAFELAHPETEIA